MVNFNRDVNCNPSILLQNVGSNIHEGTYVIIEVPRHPSINSLNILVFNDMTCRHIYLPDHVNRFTEKSIEIMIRDVGLKSLVWTFGQDAYEFLMIPLAGRKVEKNDFIDYIIKSIQRYKKVLMNQVY